MSKHHQPDDQDAPSDVAGGAVGKGAEPPPSQPAGQPAGAIDKVPLFVAVQRMTVAERMQFARRADKEGRGLLMRDSNKQVALAALGNPKLTIEEVEQFAKSRQLDGNLLREIASNIEWLKHYSVLLALALNPKTPLALALKMLPRLRTHDLKLLGSDRNLPTALRTTALRLLKLRQERG